LEKKFLFIKKQNRFYKDSMIKIYQNMLLFCLIISLSACPYREIYKAVSQINGIYGLEIRPVKLVFISHKRIATCDVIYRITNPTDSTQKVNFSKSFLINMIDTLKIDKIFAAHYGTNIPVESIFQIRPQNDTLIAFSFKDLKQKFGDSLEVMIDISGVGKSTFIYKKIK